MMRRSGFILPPHLDVRRPVSIYLRDNHHWPATDSAVLNILLPRHSRVDYQLIGFTAIRATDNNGFQQAHQLTPKAMTPVPFGQRLIRIGLEETVVGAGVHRHP